MGDESRISPDTIVAIAAVFIAILSLFFTINQNRASRAHDKLSVQPHLIVETFGDQANLNYKIDVQNVGIGPANIVAARLYVDGKEIETKNVGLSLETVLMASEMAPFVSHGLYGWFEEGDAISVNGKKTLASIRLDPVHVESALDKIVQSQPSDNGGAEYLDELKHHARAGLFQKLNELFDKIQIEIEYESFYGDDSRVASYK